MNKGFTIIELIVVIAIIAVLAAIVLVNVLGYINKANDAAIKENFNTIFTNSASYFYIYSNYTSFSSDAGYKTPAAAIKNANGGSVLVVNTTPAADHFCVCSVLTVTSGDTYCISDTGYKKETGRACSDRCIAGVCSD
ncbi:MAG: prepilin-type N-terminal cleavage/methylation domain-containing protein [Candidatus Staskawiczbacteria bacterium]|jgi:prepilin-type N-terminal cleavage/methylation domain-containing protein